MLNMVADTSTRGLAEDEFRLAAEACWKAAPDAMVALNANGEILLVNVQAEKRFGYCRDELLGKHIAKLIPEGFSEMLGEDALAEQTGIGIELQGRRKDGSEFPVEIMLGPIEGADERLVTATIRDISARKRAERLKDEFVTTVSHELRTPMTSISGALSLLAGQWGSILPESAARLLAIAHKNSQRLVRLINDILDIEKLEAGRVVFNLDRVDAVALLKQTMEADRVYAENFGVRLRLETVAADAGVRADADRLAQVFTNLLCNAIKFSPPDEEVLVTVVQKGSMVRISVHDHGCGIPADFKPHIFEKFAQADGTSSKEKSGTGLGLSIVKQIVERLGGEVGFEDAPGGGTIFYVAMPAWEGTGESEIDGKAAADAKRILLCEDDYETAAAIRTRLGQAEFAVDVAHTVAAARSYAEATLYAAILVDLQFPDGDGITLIQNLRTLPQYRNTPIAVISSDPIRGRDDVRSSKLNILSWFGKPPDFRHLVMVLKASIASDTHRRPCILHVDDDRNLLPLVARAFSTVADVISADTLKSARRAIIANHIDMVLLDISLGSNSGLELLPDLRNKNGDLIPVIVLSAHDTGLQRNGQIEVVLTKSQASLKTLVEIVCNRLMPALASASKEVA
ncbi:ATP-binding protein [Methyloferula stellata]|uniref:ATP-binding protein n=1 Tax=Methyloferula stellata TaxID=876270 RepID=UPI0003A4A070|nr:ATP-binding protein [Methyloferula stellata]